MRDTTSHALKLKFSDMPGGVRNRWVSWCFRHDWCKNAGIILYDWGALDFFVEDTDGETHIFKNPQELRDWAGY